MLLAAKADPRARIIDDSTTLGAAVYGGRAVIATMLLDADAQHNAYSAESFLDMKRVNGDTVLHIAASKSLLDFVEIFIARGANLRCLNVLQKTPLQNARLAKPSRQQKSIIRLLSSR